MLAVILDLDFCDLISIIFSFIIVYYQLSFCRFEKGAYPKDLQTCCIVSRMSVKATQAMQIKKEEI